MEQSHGISTRGWAHPCRSVTCWQWYCMGREGKCDWVLGPWLVEQTPWRKSWEWIRSKHTACWHPLPPPPPLFPCILGGKKKGGGVALKWQRHCLKMVDFGENQSQAVSPFWLNFWKVTHPNSKHVARCDWWVLAVIFTSLLKEKSSTTTTKTGLSEEKQEKMPVFLHSK